MFPPEIWYLILNYIDDPEELLKLRQVSKTWHFIIQRILSRTPKFRIFCEKIMSQSCLKQILLKHQCSEVKFVKSPLMMPWYNTITNNTWSVIYECWKKWQACVDIDPYISEISLQEFEGDSYSRLTCTATYDNMLAIASDTGSVLLFEIDDPIEPSNKISCPWHTNDYVFEMKFWYTKKRLIIAMAYYTSRRLEFWDVDFGAPLLGEIFLADRLYSHNNECWAVANLGRPDLIGYDDVPQTLTLFNVQSNIVERHMVIQLDVFTMYDNRCFMTANDEFTIPQIHIFTRDLTPMKMQIISHSMVTNNNGAKQIVTSNDATDVKVLKEMKNYDFKIIRHLVDHRVLVAETIDRSLAISVGYERWSIYKNAIQCIGGRVLSAVFHANLMIFGLRQGKLFIFRVNNIDDLMNLDFETLHSKTIKLDCNAGRKISRVDIVEARGNRYIIAESKRKAHVIEFNTVF